MVEWVEGRGTLTHILIVPSSEPDTHLLINLFHLTWGGERREGEELEEGVSTVVYFTNVLLFSDFDVLLPWIISFEVP